MNRLKTRLLTLALLGAGLLSAAIGLHAAPISQEMDGVDSEELATLAVTPPARQNSQGLTGDILPSPLFSSGKLLLAIGDPTESIAATWLYRSDRERTPNCDFIRTARKKTVDAGKDFRIIIMLPGYGLSRVSMVNYAKYLANNGFLSILADPPGQGESSGDHIGFGPYEAQYISGIASTIRNRCINGNKSFVALLGFSYGAVISLATGAHDKSIDAIIALAPYTNVRNTLTSKLRLEHHTSLTGTTLSKLSGTNSVAGTALLAAVARKIGFPIEELLVPAMIAQASAPVLILSGVNDGFFALDDIDDVVNGKKSVAVTRIDGLGHQDLLFQHEVVDEMIANWLAGLTKAPGAEIRKEE